VPLGEYPELTAEACPRPARKNYGGAIVTAGASSFAPAPATTDSGVDKETGAELWSAKLPYVGNSPPATYQ